MCNSLTHNVFVADAYKHVAVSPRDWRLQIFEFGGRYFQDTTLTFGCVRLVPPTLLTIFMLLCLPIVAQRCMTDPTRSYSGWLRRVLVSQEMRPRVSWMT